MGSWIGQLTVVFQKNDFSIRTSDLVEQGVADTVYVFVV